MVGGPSWCGLEAKKFEKGQYRIVGLRVVENSILLLASRIVTKSNSCPLHMDPKILKFLKTQNSFKLSNSILGGYKYI